MIHPNEKTVLPTPSLYKPTNCLYTDIISIDELLDNIGTITSEDLLQLIRRKCDEVSKEIYYRPENFKYHKEVEYFAYAVRDIDGKIIYRHYIGSKAYEYYLRSPEAYTIDRYTKDLFPTYEELLRKEAVSA